MVISSGEESALGQSSRRPKGVACFIDRSNQMDVEEDRLRLTIVAQAGNASRCIPLAAVESAIRSIPGVLAADDVLIRKFYPENFFIVCKSQAIRDLVLGAQGVPVAGTTLVFRPWTRLAHADSSALFYRMQLEVEGIPPHAWSRDTASKLLASSCWIEKLDDASGSKSDLSVFKLTAWTG